eukprot:TRINITY_DN885_c0_g1_i3.p1 TRINITY_DN885_c0_g1~~TRINITY_DN885_c0_g1_i3.p1  ORF type:complete len:282 (+),score=60.54 TRINITY_DN885_c0_g1_i3:361-1206(+)
MAAKGAHGGGSARWLASVDELAAWDASLRARAATAPLQPVEEARGPRLLVCHDMMGGYLEQDKFAQGEGLSFEGADVYHITAWQRMHSFCYFSHHRVTIPPCGWINAAHVHGVRVLGTFITEGKEGEIECVKLLANPEFHAEQLAHIVKYYGFDGWLLNIENAVAPNYADGLMAFVKSLTQSCHQAVPGSEVIWYDSVTCNGDLLWQNYLTPLNYTYFKQCDGLFTNYSWVVGDPQKSAAAAPTRPYDVYTGIDVFGRSTFPAGFECTRALDAIAECATGG